VSDLNEQDAQKLFEEVSKTFQDNDSVKLSELMKTEAGEEPAPVEDKPAEEPAEVVDTEKVDDPTKVSEDKSDDTTPPAKAETADDEEEDKPEQTEVEKLKELLEKATKENHALRSQAGRVPHIQRRMKEIDRKLEALNKQTTSPSSQPSAKIQPKVIEALAGIKETDPELADTIAKVIAQVTDGVAQDLSTKEIESLQAQRAEEYKAYQEEEATRLLDMFPNARDVFQSDGWKAWKREQTAQVVQFAESDNADDVAFAFERYANDMIARNPELRQVAEKKVETVPPVQNAEAAQKIEAERQRKKEVAVNISNPSTPGKTSLPDDPKALFEKYSEEIRKSISG
jgi:hypothetical protein